MMDHLGPIPAVLGPPEKVCSIVVMESRRRAEHTAVHCSQRDRTDILRLHAPV